MLAHSRRYSLTQTHVYRSRFFHSHRFVAKITRMQKLEEEEDFQISASVFEIQIKANKRTNFCNQFSKTHNQDSALTSQFCVNFHTLQYTGKFIY